MTDNEHRLGYLTDWRTNLGYWRADCDRCPWVGLFYVERATAVRDLAEHLAWHDGEATT